MNAKSSLDPLLSDPMFTQQEYAEAYIDAQPKANKNLPASSFLQAGLTHMLDREAAYDSKGGERSIGATVKAFQAITGIEMTEEQGWLFMVCLKAVRCQQGYFKPDNYEDLAAYAGLMGESASIERQ